MTKTLLFLFLIYNVHCFSQQIIIPNKYVELKKSPSNGKEIKARYFKMDNDSLDDAAMIVEHIEKNNDYKILIFLSSLNKQFELQYIDDDWEFLIYPNQLEVKKNVLTFSYCLDGTAAFCRILKLRYNEKQKNIQLIGYDSSYRRSGDVYIEKSYNLLTGKYIVNKRTFLSENSKVESHQGNKKTKELFINEINNQLFYKLDEAGSEFEN